MINLFGPLAYIIALLTAFAVGAFAGWNHEHQNLVLYKAEVRAQSEAQQKVNDAVVAMQTKKTKEIANEYQTRLATIRAYYNGLRQPANSGKLSAVSDTTGGADGRRTDDLLGQCAETTLQLMELQRWVRGVTN